MEMARFAGQIEPDLQPIVEDYERLTPPAQGKVDIDAMCKMREIDPFHFMSVVAEAAAKFRDNSSIIIAAMNMPSVVDKAVKVAMTTEGVQDRKMLFQHANFIPTPGGTSINILNKNAAMAQANNKEADTGLPSFESSVMDVEEAVRE